MGSVASHEYIAGAERQLCKDAVLSMTSWLCPGPKVAATTVNETRKASEDDILDMAGEAGGTRN